ncbi:hypothetical protein OBBRIDRAFT_663222 [Obba rivulosa]|uniref:Uncharacterized protein n=1 Tax=Obba rivulosa TaxID=1052685 RepID=A0A8E2AR62_9APHY|nr:hypothetical protein OBBRIDRAFT_663222 [Obba rivulosa]
MSDFLRKHPFPWFFSAAVSRALDGAGIPHILWGDHIDNLYGAPICPALCAFVVQEVQLKDAEAVADRLGLESMRCSLCLGETAMHFLRPHVPDSEHWFIKEEMSLAFVSSNECDFLDLLPLIDAHPNPLELSLRRAAVFLSDTGQSARRPFAQTYSPSDPSVHVVRFLTAPSLLKILTLLTVSQRATGGLGMPWMMLLDRIYMYMQDMEVDGKPLMETIEDPGLARMSQMMMRAELKGYTREQMARAAIKLSRYDLKVCHD